ncbi:MAG TPA: RNA polymerase subunit sigma-70 [Candidatus Limnocylindrales bacterium]|nr:RNA polymerase subunit sigma-70 [Candidatus Limnocylindrales bacterium]
MDSVIAAAARAGDPSAFSELVERHRHELQVHCYRMLGSVDDAEDAVQETLLRAWRSRASFEGRSTFRAWLYRIATNASFDLLERHPRPRLRPPAATTDGPPSRAAEVRWLQPYPDGMLDLVAPSEHEPEAAVVDKETIELAFLVALQHLPPRQRAVLLLRDVVGWSAPETARLLDLTLPAVKSALQRARTTMRAQLPPHRLHWASPSTPSAEERALLQRFIEANERADMEALASLLREDAWQSMPPGSVWFAGRPAMLELWASAMAGPTAHGDWRLLPTAANRQPAAANYLRRPGDTVFLPSNLDVLRIRDNRIAEILTFGAEVFPAFGLPASLE